MDLELLRPLMTVIMFSVFGCIVMWAWQGRQRSRFDAAARLPFDEENHPNRASGNGPGGRRR